MGRFTINEIILLMVLALVFGALLPTIADDTVGQVANATNTNITGASATLVTLVPLFLTIVIILGLVRRIRAN